MRTHKGIKPPKALVFVSVSVWVSVSASAELSHLSLPDSCVCPIAGARTLCRGGARQRRSILCRAGAGAPEPSRETSTSASEVTSQEASTPGNLRLMLSKTDRLLIHISQPRAATTRRNNAKQTCRGSTTRRVPSNYMLPRSRDPF